MGALLFKIGGFIVSGLVFRLLASIGFSLATMTFISTVVNEYVNKSLQLLNYSLPSVVINLMGIAKLDIVLSLWINALIFITTYKSLKFIFIRK